MQFSRSHQRVTHPLRENQLGCNTKRTLFISATWDFCSPWKRPLAWGEGVEGMAWTQTPGSSFSAPRSSHDGSVTGENSGEQLLHHLFQSLSVKNMLPGDYITTSICRALYSLRSTFIYYFSTLANALQLWLPREVFWHPVPMVFHDRILI